MQTIQDNYLLENWARQYRKPLLRYFDRRAPANAESDDLVQEVFIRLAKRVDLSSVRRVDSYLFQTASNVLADWYRKDSRSLDLAGIYDDSLHGEPGLTPESVNIDRQSLDQLVQALHQLPESTRNIFVLYHFDNMRQTDIAASYGMPISTVEKHMARANKHLLESLERKR